MVLGLDIESKFLFHTNVSFAVSADKFGGIISTFFIFHNLSTAKYPLPPKLVDFVKGISRVV